MTQWERASDARAARERIFVDDIRRCVPDGAIDVPVADGVISADDVAGVNPFRTDLTKDYTGYRRWPHGAAGRPRLRHRDRRDGAGARYPAVLHPRPGGRVGTRGRAP
ncbi:MAG: hypothetical protein OXI95_15400 [bacterium]|nr:hypothetical protein [bacterium]